MNVYHSSFLILIIISVLIVLYTRGPLVSQCFYCSHKIDIIKDPEVSEAIEGVPN